MKKYLQKLSAITLALSLLSNNVYASVSVDYNRTSIIQSTTATITNSDYEYKTNDNGTTIEITKYNGSDTTVVIPDNINELPVTIVGGFRDNNTIVSVTIPDTVTKLSSNAFDSCKRLETVSLGNSVVTIGGRAFYACDGLLTINIPDSVTSIEGSAFSDCSSLNQVQLSKSLISLGTQAFRDCTNLKSIELPDTVTSIGEWCFYNCIDLISVKLPNYITEIPNMMFAECKSLTSFEIPYTVTKIDTSAFHSCISLNNIEIPSSITSIESYAFYNCNNLTNVTIPDSVVYLGEGVFGFSDNLVSVTLPNSINRIRTNTFHYNKNLKTITIPSNIKIIDYNAFDDCSSLDGIYFEGDAPSFNDTLGDDGKVSRTSILGVSYSSNATYNNCILYYDENTSGWDALISEYAVSYPHYKFSTTSGNPPNVVVAQTPTINSTNFSTTPTSYEQNNSNVTPLTVSASVSDGGTLSYQWYANDVAINGATSLSYTPSVSEIGTKAYHCVVTNTLSSNTATNNTDKISITITSGSTESTKVETPTINSTNFLTTPTSYEQNSSNVTPLTVSASVTDGGTLSYQWYSNNVAINGATSLSYTPSASEIGTKAYHCVVTNTLSSDTAINNTDKISITITSNSTEGTKAETPTINSTNFSTTPTSYEQNSSNVTPLTVSASISDGGTLSYQWYANNVAISGATSSSYTPSTSEIGTNEYYCVITNTPTSSGLTASTNKTDNISITINEIPTNKAEVPTINSTNFDSVQRSYTQNQTNPEALTINASVTDGGTLSYQWYVDGSIINNATSSSYTPTTNQVGTKTYYCIVKNTPTVQTISTVDNSSTKQTESVNITVYENGSSSGVVATPTLTENYASQVTYYLNNNASDLSIQVNASRIESDNLTYTWYKASDNYSNGSAIQSGTLDKYSISNIYITPSTNTLGSSYYYCVVTNTYNGQSKSITSDKIRVVVLDRNSSPTYPNNDLIDSYGNIYANAYSNVYINQNSLENYLNTGNNNIYINGSNIQSINVSNTNYNTSPYTVNVRDNGTGLNYSWKIYNGRNVSSNLDLSVSTASTYSNVNSSYTNLNYDANYSQVLRFKHNGSLNADGSSMFLSIPTTVSDGTVWLYKLSNGNILANTEVQASVSNGILHANIQSCSDWVISKIKLIDVTGNNNNDLFYNIKTDARLNIPQFQNVVLGSYINLSSINTNFFTGYRFEGWYYDTAFTQPITGNFLTSIQVTSTLINNGIYPKLTYYNTHVPDDSFSVPSTGGFGLNRLI